MTMARPREDVFVQGDAHTFALDLGPGYLGQSLLPYRSIADAYQSVMSDYPTESLSYGPGQGPKPAREAISALLGTDPESIMITGGISATLDSIASIYRPQGGTVITESVSYDLANMIFRDHGYQVARAPSDETDPVVALERALYENCGEVAFVYLAPTLANPTGRTMTDTQRQALIEVALRFDTPIVEDDAYAHHVDPVRRQASLTELGKGFCTRDGRPLAIGLGSASKVLGAGLRVGWLHAPPTWLRTFRSRGVFQSGGCWNQITSLVLADLINNGVFSSQAEHVRTVLAERAGAFRAAVAATSDGLIVAPEQWQGGMFDWIETPDSVELASAAELSGIRVYPGLRFGDAGRKNLRVSFGAVDSEQAATVGRELGRLTICAPSGRSKPYREQR